jgi:hypothetical protein
VRKRFSIRFCTELRNDLKVQSLPGGIFKAWINLLCAAAETDGRLILGNGFGNVSETLHATVSETESIVSRLVESGFLKYDGEDYLLISDWKDYQHASDLSTDRVRKFREKMKRSKKRSRNVSETLLKRNETLSRAGGHAGGLSLVEESSEANASAADAARNVSSDLEQRLFDHGKQVLGKGAGGLIAKLKAQRGLGGALAAIEEAASKQDPREYVGACLREPPDRRTQQQREWDDARNDLREANRRNASRDSGGSPDGLLPAVASE